MFPGFADASASSLRAKFSLPETQFDIPLIDDIVSGGPYAHPRLFIISGMAQTYKTTLAVQLLTPFLSSYVTSSQAIWLDADLRFPLDLLQSRDLHLDKLAVAPCRSSEDIIFNLLDLDNSLLHSDRLSNLRAIVIDGLNSSFWIDELSRQFVKRANRFALKDLVDRFVSLHGITVIVVMQDLGDFEIWKATDSAVTLRLRCTVESPGAGVGSLACESFESKFSVKDDRNFQWARKTSRVI
jgi:hypothetical protein